MLFEGPVAIAFVHGDAAAAAKALREFGKNHEALVLKGGLLGERVITPVEIEALADLPSREVLLTQIAGLFQQPLTRAAGLFQAFTAQLRLRREGADRPARRRGRGRRPSTKRRPRQPADDVPAADDAPTDDAPGRRRTCGRGRCRARRGRGRAQPANPNRPSPSNTREKRDPWQP